MPELFFGTSHYDRDRGNFVATPVVNMFAEAVPVEGRVVLQSRPGLENSGTSMGAGPVKALFKNDGVLSGALYGISNNSLYEGATLRGAINGTGPAKIDGYENKLFATAGDQLWGWDGVTLSVVATPNSFQTLDLCIGASRLVVIEKNSGRFWWSDALTSTIDAISFATAENSPDRLKACLYVGDVLVLFGSKTVEFWPITQDGSAPFQPLVGRTYAVGIKDTGCATPISSTFAWITNHNQVCIADPENILSYPDLEAKIEASATSSLWTFRLEGVEYLAVRLDDETHVWSSRSKQWSLFESYGQTNWIPQCYAADYFGSAVDGRLVQWSDGHEDFDDIMERKFRAGLVIEGGAVPLNNISIRTNPGQTPFLSGDYADPTVELRLSRDGGNVFGDWKGRSLGVQGSYRPRVQWRSLGLFSQPGLVAEFRVTDPVPFRVANVVANERYGSI